MKIDIWHNILWSRYKARVFSELYKQASALKHHVEFTQIAATSSDRISLSHVDYKAHTYPYKLLFNTNYNQISKFKILYVLTSKIRQSQADIAILAGYEKLEYWAQLIILILKKQKRAVFCDSELVRFV